MSVCLWFFITASPDASLKSKARCLPQRLWTYLHKHDVTSFGLQVIGGEDDAFVDSQQDALVLILGQGVSSKQSSYQLQGLFEVSTQKFGLEIDKELLSKAPRDHNYIKNPPLSPCEPAHSHLRSLGAMTYPCPPSRHSSS